MKVNHGKTRTVLVGLATGALLLASSQMVMAAGEAKNVILMISRKFGRLYRGSL